MEQYQDLCGGGLDVVDDVEAEIGQHEREELARDGEQHHGGGVGKKVRGGREVLWT